MGWRRGPEPGLRPLWEAAKCELTDTSPEGEYWLTKLLIIVNVLIFLSTWPASNPESVEHLPTVTCILELECVGRMLGAMFLHADLAHIVGNMIYLYIVGDNVEITLGRARFLVIYLASGVAGAVAHSAISLVVFSDLPPFLLGASGAISGLLGAYLVLYPGSRMCRCVGFRLVYYCFPLSASTFLAFWIGLQIFMPALNPMVAAFAHLAGLFTGAGLTYLLASQDLVDRARLKLLRGRYRGFPVDREVLDRPSASGVVLAILILAGVMLGGLVGYSAGRLWECRGTHYAVKVEYLVREYMRPPPWVVVVDRDRPYTVVVSVEDAWVEACGARGGARLIYWYKTKLVTKTLEEGVLDTAPYTASATAAALTALILLSLKALLSPERFEVTYIPPRLREGTGELRGQG